MVTFVDGQILTAEALNTALAAASTGATGPVGATGPTGPTGAQGISATIKGSVPTVADLPPGPALNDAYIVLSDQHLYIWTGTSWTDAGQIVGPTGPTGATGPSGPASTVPGPTGPTGPAGPTGVGVTGATGPSGPSGPPGATGPSGAGATGPSGLRGPTGPSGPSGPSGARGATGPSGTSNPTVTLSNAGVAMPGTYPRPLSDVAGDIRSVKGFAPPGAESNNDYDWTAAIQAAVDSMSGGGTVYFPPRSLWYRIDGTITVSSNGITVDGNNNVLQWYNDVNLFTVTGSSFTLKNIRIYNNGSTTYSPANYCVNGGVNASNMRLDNVTCLDCGSGLLFRSNLFWVSDCEFSSLPQDGYGVYINASGPGDGIGFISSSIFSGTGNDFGPTGILTPGQRPNACIFCEDGGAVQIDSCELMQSKYSLLLRPNSTVGAMGSFMCSNTFFDTFDYAGISYDNAANPTAHFQRNLFSNCWISNGGQTNKTWNGSVWEDIPTGEGILIPDNCNVDGLQVNNCQFFGDNFGILIGNNCTLNGITITDSVFGLTAVTGSVSHYANADISIGSNAENFSIEGNSAGTNGGWFPSINGVYINSNSADFLINNNRLDKLTIDTNCNNYVIDGNILNEFTDVGDNPKIIEGNLIDSGGSNLLAATVTNSANLPYSGAVSRQVSSMIGDVLNVADFGALTDGSDAGPAIQNAINAASQYGRPLLFYGATYTIKTAIEIKSNVRLQGTAGTTLFIAADCTDGPSFGGAARQVYTNTGAYNISLDSIIFKSTTSGLTKAISVAFRDVTGLNINNCEFRDFGNSAYSYYSQGFILFGGNDVVITNNIFTGNSGDGCAVSNNVTDFVFSGNTSSFNGDWGFAIVDGCNNGTVSGNLFLDNTSTATGATRSNDITFTGNICRNCEHGVRIARFPGSQTDQKYITISDNVVYGCDTGISVEDMYNGSNYTISGNTIMFSGGAGVSISNCENGVISANQITSSGSEGIVFVSYTGSNSGLATVTGNSIHVCTIGIRQVNSGGGVSVISVSNNLITGNSSIPIDLLNAYQGTGYNLPTQVSGSRTLGNTYQNTKPYPMMVSVTATSDAAGQTDFLVVLVGSNNPLVYGSGDAVAVEGPGGTIQSSYGVSVTFLVPPSKYYRVYNTRGFLNTISAWVEY